MANAFPNAAERARFRRYWLVHGFLLPIVSQAGALPPVCPLYTPCMPPILNTLATGLSVAWRTLAAPERVQRRWLTDLERVAGRALPWRAGRRPGGQIRGG